MKKQNKKYYVIAGLCLAGAISFGGIGIYKYLQEKNAGKIYEEVKKEVVIEELVEPEQEVQQPQTEIPIDFKTLQTQNQDIYAWIKIPETNVDYPIVQNSDDNGYYLNHDIYGEKKAEGAIFTENYNTKTFEDPNTVIYGHDMKNGSMFQSIHKYMDRSFFDKNREIIVYLPDQILHYEIFAAYLYDNRHLLMSFDFWNKEEYKRYLDSVFAMRNMNAFIDTSMEVTNEDKIITLSTCYAGIASQRYLVQAVLVSIEK